MQAEARVQTHRKQRQKITYKHTRHFTHGVFEKQLSRDMYCTTILPNVFQAKVYLDFIVLKENIGLEVVDGLIDDV